MFKLLRRLICILILAAIAFVVISVLSGGEKFRWFGKNVEQRSEKVGEEADKLKEKSDKVLKGIEKAKEKVKGFIGKKDEKSR